MAGAKAVRWGELASAGRPPGWLENKQGKMKVARGGFKKEAAAKGFDLILFTLAVTRGSETKE